MHQHLTPQKWVLAFGDPEDASGCQLYTCPQCSPSRGDLMAWLEAIEQCPKCTAALEAYEPLPLEALDCGECMAAYRVFVSPRRTPSGQA